MDEIKPGDVVVLKSGGPKMTVEKIGKNAQGIPTAWCVWFEGSTPQKGAFPIQAIDRWE
jgi:uncharacterized protein YodC (DUF2158 family)